LRSSLIICALKLEVKNWTEIQSVMKKKFQKNQQLALQINQTELPLHPP
jgi:F0F1-type ATP synthase delta subunit